MEAAVATTHIQANYIASGKELRTEVISSAGLMKMACCNLAKTDEATLKKAIEKLGYTAEKLQVPDPKN